MVRAEPSFTMAEASPPGLMSSSRRRMIEERQAGILRGRSDRVEHEQRSWFEVKHVTLEPGDLSLVQPPDVAPAETPPVNRPGTGR